MLESIKSPADIKQGVTLENAVQMINDGKVTCVIINKGEIVHTEYGRGVSPLLNIFA